MKQAVVFCLISCLSMAMSQTCLSNSHWWVGGYTQKVILDFTTGAYPPPFATTSLTSTNNEGTTAYTNHDGTLWFISDGDYLYDMRTPTPTTVSSTLPGNPSTNVPALIMSQGNGLFSLFTNDAFVDTGFLGTAKHYVIDSNVIPATITEDPSFAITGTLEGAKILAGKNSYTFWHCVFQKSVAASETFPDFANLVCSEFDVTGYLRTVVNPLPSSISVGGKGKGALDYSPTTNKVLVSIGDSTYTYNFDVLTGLLINPTFLFTRNLAFYDMTFSPSGDIIYFFDFDGSTSTAARYQISSNTFQFSSESVLFGSELGPDGRVYYEVVNQNYLVVVDNTDDFSSFSLSRLVLSGKNGGNNLHVNAPCGALTTDCTSTCDDSIPCTVDICDASGECANVPTVGCTGVGGDPYIFTMDGNHKVEFIIGNYYDFHKNPERYSIVIKVDSTVQFVTEIGVNFYSSRLLATTNSAGDPEFYFNDFLLEIGDTVQTPIGILECYYPDNTLLNFGPLSSLSRYIRIGVKIENQLFIVGGYHPGAGAFYNIASRLFINDTGLLPHFSANSVHFSERDDHTDLVSKFEVSSLF